MTRLLQPITEAYQSLGISRSTLYQLIKEGQLTPVKIGRRTFIAQAELERYVDRLQGGQAA